MRERRDALRQRHAEISLLLKSTPTYWIGGTSMAGMVEALARNNEAIFHCSVEAGEPVRIALGKHTKDHAADFDLLLSGYSVERIGNTTISRGDHRLTPCISLLWMVQPFLLRELIANEEALERGLTARMLPFVFEPERIAEDDGKIRCVTDAAKSDWSNAPFHVSDSADIMPEPELSEGLWLLAFIRSTICPEANFNVKYEMRLFGDRGNPL